MKAKLAGIVIDCPNPLELAPFYQELTGARRIHDAVDWVTLLLDPEQSAGLTLSLQQVDNYQPPSWRGVGPPQQLHLDLLVDNLDVAQERVLALGGRVLEGSEKPIGYRVYADPIGHPFCLVTPEGIPGSS